MVLSLAGFPWCHDEYLSENSSCSFTGRRCKAKKVDLSLLVATANYSTLERW